MMPNAKPRTESPATVHWTLVRQGNRLLPKPGLQHAVQVRAATSKHQRIPCVFVVDGKVDCEVRVLGKSQSRDSS